MKHTGIYIISFLFTALSATANPTLESYRLYDNSGKEVSFGEMVDSLGEAEVVFIGENHNCPISHWMEYEITKALHDKHGDKLKIGEEMLEADNQLLIDEYFSNLISYDRFETEARLWDNYSTDYYPVVYYAKDNGIPMIATNVPRRYANAVNNGGLECLEAFTQEAKNYMAPLPIPFEYDEEGSADKFGIMMMLSRKTPEEMKRLAEAQALKDATMGWFISKNMEPDTRFVHLNGTMHSNGGEGIIPYLKHYRPETKIATVTSLRVEDITSLDPEYLGMADFYIVVPEDFPTSY
ncbi:MAG: ChaN family lipoprotein [Muribaculaceae bacterium]|nr:ChaN family lipoprotein [Muribaculaceae bacterium]